MWRVHTYDFRRNINITEYFFFVSAGTTSVLQINGLVSIICLEGHSPKKVVLVCPVVKTPFSHISRRYLDP